MIWRRYLDSQINEIENGPGLHFYGLSLIFVHFLTSLYWFYKNSISALSPGLVSYCWPFLPGCDYLRLNFSLVIQGLFFLYFSLSVLGIFIGLASSRRLWWVLFFLEAGKFLISSLDYQFMGNYHYMPHIITLSFLFFNKKRFWCSLWLVTFYAAAASLKFNFEWLSGASLSWRIPFGSERALIWGAFLVPPLELLCPLMCLQREIWIRRFGLFALLLFHLFSYYWVGFFYPAIMTSLLALWLVAPVTIDLQEAKGFVLRLRGSQLIQAILWISFVVVQINVMRTPEKHALLGESRLWSLNMFDARAFCRGFFLEKSGNEWIEVDFKNETLPVRVHCDNLFFMEQARRLCLSREDSSSPIAAFLISRPASSLNYREVVREKNVCDHWSERK